MCTCGITLASEIGNNETRLTVIEPGCDANCGNRLFCAQVDDPERVRESRAGEKAAC